MVQGLVSLEAYRDALNRLAARALEPNPFYEPWMVFPAVELLEDARACSFILVFRKEPGSAPQQLCGFFPVMERLRYLGLPVRNYTLLQHRYCFLTVPLLDRDFSQPALAAFFDWCRSNAGIGLVEFPTIPVSGPFHQLLADVVYGMELPARPERRYTRALYQAAASPEAYLAESLSGKSRWHLRRKRRRLEELGQVEYSAFERESDPETWLRDFLALEASGWKGDLGTALGSSEKRREYFLRIGLDGLKTGQVFGSSLRLDGRMIAGRALFAAGGGSFLFKIAYSEDLASCSPGNLLEVQTIERGLPEGVRWTDSCTVPQNTMYRWLWKDLLTIENVLVAPGSNWGDLLFSVIPLAQWVKRRLRKLRAKVALRRPPVDPAKTGE
jgi:hypothetical protein